MTTYYVANNITSFNQILRYANDITAGIFGTMILIIIFSVSFIYMKQGNTGNNASVFAASCFITMVFSVMLFMLGVVNDITMYVCIIATALSTFANIISSKY